MAVVSNQRWLFQVDLNNRFALLMQPYIVPHPSIGIASEKLCSSS